MRGLAKSTEKDVATCEDPALPGVTTTHVVDAAVAAVVDAAVAATVGGPDLGLGLVRVGRVLVALGGGISLIVGSSDISDWCI